MITKNDVIFRRKTAIQTNYLKEVQGKVESNKGKRFLRVGRLHLILGQGMHTTPFGFLMPAVVGGGLQVVVGRGNGGLPLPGLKILRICSNPS